MKFEAAGMSTPAVFLLQARRQADHGEPAPFVLRELVEFGRQLVLASEAVEERLHWWIALWQRLLCGSHHRRNRF
jgi:hypothetical protein